MMSPEPWERADESGADVDAAIDRECWRLLGTIAVSVICAAALILTAILLGGI